jgi:hypothetical protein
VIFGIIAVIASWHYNASNKFIRQRRMKGGMLANWRTEKVIQLCLPETRVGTALKLAHNMPFSSHMAFGRTNDRISTSLLFPGQRARIKDHFMRCETCKLFAPARRSDLNVIEPIPT